ncbi:hypothetical protein AAVH_05427 [Aphelenchoides avenae]|nr:hypothetical protein AAVH_05427 [Aphelenchus avenae]
MSQVDVSGSSSTALNPALFLAAMPSTSLAAPKVELLHGADMDSGQSELETHGLPQNVTADLLLVRMSSFKLTRELVAEWKRLLALLQCVVKSYTEGNCRLSAATLRTAKALARFLADTLAHGIKHAQAVTEYTLLFAETMSKLCQFVVLNNGTALEREFCGLFRDPLRQWFLNRAVRSTRAKNSWYSTRELLHVMIASLSYNDLILTVKEVVSRTAADILQGIKKSSDQSHVKFALTELDALSAFVTQYWQTSKALPMTFDDAGPLRSEQRAQGTAAYSVPGNSKMFLAQRNVINDADVPGTSRVVMPSSSNRLTSGQSKRPGDQVDGPGGKRARTLEGISLDELRQDDTLKRFGCPVCGRTVKDAKAKAKIHLLRHLRDKAFHTHKCPTEACDFSSMILDNVASHVRSVHKLEWTVHLKSASVNTANKALVDSIMNREAPLLP